jgi:pyridoxal phosphate enzyme (YggS family)
MNLEQSIDHVKERINQACARSGRHPEQVSLVAVTKTLPVETVKQAYDAGLRIFGESKAQEVRDKVPVLPGDINWHFIGHLQTNKIKYVFPASDLIHSVDSVPLAHAISEFSSKNELKPEILLEVNTSTEDSKFGIEPGNAVDIFFEISELAYLKLRGLMTIAPFTDDESLIRKSFRTLAKIRDDIQNQSGSDEKLDLSMGMSGDFEIAIEEGSTIVRIGASIFGPRRR